MNGFAKRVITIALWVIGGGSAFVAVISLASIWSPRILGFEREWDLATGEYFDVSFFLFKEVSRERVTSEFEFLFLTDSAGNHRKLIIYSRSVLQPARGRRAMSIANYAKKILQTKENLSEIERVRLITLGRVFKFKKSE